MEKYTNEELLEVLPPHIRELKSTILSPKQKAVLGQLIILDGLDKKNSEGYIFRSNGDLCFDCDIKEEKTVITAVRKLVWMGFVDTVRGSRKEGASLYRINRKVIDDYCNTPVEEYSNDYSEQIAEMADRIRELETTVKKLVERITVIEGKNYSTDTDIDKELDIDKDINNNILNNIYSINNNILEETVSIKEPERGESVEMGLEFQPVINESQTSSPVNEEFQVVSVPTSQKELMDYFKIRMEIECRDKNLDELNVIQESLKDELDSFNEIRGYKDVYRYFIVPSMNKKREKLQEKEFESFIMGI